MEQEAIIKLAQQLVQFVPVVVGLFLSLVFFTVAIRLLLRSDWETDRQPFITGILFIFLGCWAATGTTGMSSSLCEMTGLLIIGGGIWYARWLFQQWFKGFPVIGQQWRVMGIGLVQITGLTPEPHVDTHGRTTDYGLRSEWPMDARVSFIDAHEEAREISVLQFRFKSTLIENPRPMAKRKT